jgi:ABC-type branched-subunit amino acid transport system ATPase component
MSLCATDIKVNFGGVIALNSVTVRLERGQILSVVGPNGSGKSTLFNAITGLVPLAQGHVSLAGRDLHGLPTHRRVRLGISRTFQTPRFDPDLTVRQTVMCGSFASARSGLIGSLLQSHRSRQEVKLAFECSNGILDQLNLMSLADSRMGELSIAQIRLVDVARAVAPSPRFLLLDEPAAGLTVPEQDMLTAQVRRIAKSGIGVLFVEHNFDLVRRLADDMVVLERGKILIEGKPDTVSTHPDFIEVYLGSSVKH